MAPTRHRNPTPPTDEAPRHAAPSADGGGAIEVLYDGSCPLCRREIALYRSLTPLHPVRWRDVSDPLLTPLPDGQRAALLSRFHIRQGNGRLLSGARAFIALWAALPGWRWLARLAALPGAASLLELAYRGFLLVRPGLQRIARRSGTPDRTGPVP
ncbi:MAG TPA: DUF393 domain-containing protein [Methyloversatilis sp.]